MTILPTYDISTMPYPVANGYSTTQAPRTKYFGGDFINNKPRISMTLVAETAAELIALADFYYNTINGGNDVFLAKFVFEGIRDHTWTVKIVGGFDTSYPFAEVGEKKITVEIQDDVPTIVREAMVRQTIQGN